VRSAATQTHAEPRVTSADVLEAVHQATGLPIVADYYTRLYKPEEVTTRNQTLFDALNTLADTIRLRWRWENGVLQFRSSGYYDDRVKEVPNRRFLAGFTPAQRQEALVPAGLPFGRMPLAQQQQFRSLALGSGGDGLQSLEELGGSALRVEYTRPGGFQWGAAGHPGQGQYTRWVIPLEPGPQGRRVLRPIVQERTHEAALQAVQRIDLRLRQALLEEARRADPRLEPSLSVVEEGQIVPTRLDLCFVSMPGATNARGIQLQTSFASYGIRP